MRSHRAFASQLFIIILKRCVCCTGMEDMAKYTETELESMGLKPQALPGHVAIIMDGNGRWANRRGLPRAMGHRAGTERLREIIRFSSDIGIRALTLYAFSTENWKRPQDEVGVLMNLLIEYFTREIDEMHRNGVRIRALGDISQFPDRVRQAIEAAEDRTRENDGLQLSIALNYGSRAELLRAANLAHRAAMANGEEEISQALLESFLYTAGLPELDLMIRTSGEERLSNFLLYQASYAELLFTEDFWPDFTVDRYIEALRSYENRTRRYGGLGEQA